MLGRALCGIPVRRVIRAVWVLLAVCTLSALPWMIIEFKKAQFSVHYQAWFIAGIFVILAVSASIYEVAMHLENYNRPKLQIRVVRILWMVPIYAVDSWLSLRFKEARFYIDPIRECYEAFVIYNFFMYLVAYLEDEYGDVVAYYSTKEQVPHIWPITRCLRPWRMGEEFFWETKRGVAAAPSAPTLMDCSLEAAVAAILRGKTPKSYETVAIAPLISRFPPPEGLIEWHLLRSNPAEDEDWAAQIDSAEKALHICNALATQAPSSEYALAVFEPALAQMLKAVEALEAATITSLVEEEEQGGADDSREIASGWEQLKSLSNRAVMCMNLAAKEVSVVNQAANDDVGAEADRNTRWWLSWNSNLSISDDTAGETDGNGSSRDVSDGRPRGSHHSGDVRNIARTACSVAVSLCTVARLRTFEGDDDLQVDALAAHAAHDMKILAPYAAIGQVTGAAEAVLEEINKTTDDAMLFLALYMAAIDSSDTNNAEYYFLRMIAARNASAAATSLGNTAVAGRVLSSAAVAPPPPAALEWLREQPPSSVILQALESLQRGPQGLSAHLIYEAPERAVRALAAAAKAGGVLAVGASGADGDNGQDSTPADDLLFFVSKKGDGGAFNRQDWGSDREEGSDDEDGRAGLVIDDLPDEGKSMSGEEDYNEDSDDE